MSSKKTMQEQLEEAAKKLKTAKQQQKNTKSFLDDIKGQPKLRKVNQENIKPQKNNPTGYNFDLLNKAKASSSEDDVSSSNSDWDDDEIIKPTPQKTAASAPKVQTAAPAAKRYTTADDLPPPPPPLDPRAFDNKPIQLGPPPPPPKPQATEDLSGALEKGLKKFRRFNEDSDSDSESDLDDSLDTPRTPSPSTTYTVSFSSGQKDRKMPPLARISDVSIPELEPIEKRKKGVKFKDGHETNFYKKGPGEKENQNVINNPDRKNVRFSAENPKEIPAQKRKPVEKTSLHEQRVDASRAVLDAMQAKPKAVLTKKQQKDKEKQDKKNRKNK